MGKKVFVIDVGICNGCYTCQFMCKDEHAGNDWTPIAKPQPEVGQFWCKLVEDIQGTVPQVKMSYRPHICMHCDNAPCMKACKVKGAKYKRPDGLVIINPELCTGCRNCVDVCPYEAIYFNEDLNISQKCTGCAHLLDNGWTEPRCADACPNLAIKLLDEDDKATQDLIAKAEVWRPELKNKVKPRVYYLNVPKKFVAGTVYDPVKEEVYIGADCVLTGSGDKKFKAKTNDFGDFWFKDLPDGKYKLEIKAGSKTKVIDKIDISSNSAGLGDIAM